MPSLIERLNADLKEAMRGGDAVRRDEIRGLIAMLKTEQQSKLTRMLAREGLILHYQATLEWVERSRRSLRNLLDAGTGVPGRRPLAGRRPPRRGQGAGSPAGGPVGSAAG